MLTRPLRALAFVGALCSFVPAGSAQASPSEGRVLDPSQVRGWLMRIHQAASTKNFQGTFVVSSGNTVASARIAHYYEGINQYERIESLDGQARFVFRQNDIVHTVWPQNRIVLVEQRTLVNTFPAVLQGGDDRIAEFYDVRDLGLERVTGLEANVLMLKPRDSHRFGYRLWADKASGLLLRADVLNGRNEVLETSAFSDVAIDVRAKPESVVIPMKNPLAYRVMRLALTPAKLEAEGWEFGATVPGFRQASCVKRPLDGVSQGDGNATPQILQTIFADGLTYVSVFIERYDAARHKQPMSTVLGATQTLTRRLGDFWITLVGDVPSETLQAFANALQRKKP